MDTESLLIGIFDAVKSLSKDFDSHCKELESHRKEVEPFMSKIEAINGNVSQLASFGHNLSSLPTIAAAMKTNAEVMTEIKDKLIAPATDKGWIIKIILALIGMLTTVLIIIGVVAVATIVKGTDTVVEMPGGGKVYSSRPAIAPLLEPDVPTIPTISNKKSDEHK